MRFKVLFLLSFLSFGSVAQSEIEWSGNFDVENSKALITANLKEGWHVYSMTVDEMAGPVSTKIELRENPNVEVVNEVQEPDPLVSYDENFASKLQYFEKTVTFEQELKIKESTQLEYVITFMICNDVMCFPPEDQIIKISILK